MVKRKTTREESVDRYEKGNLFLWAQCEDPPGSVRDERVGCPCARGSAALRHDGLAVLADLAGKGGGGVGEDVEDGEGEDGGEVDGAADGRDDAAEEVQIGIAQGGEGVGELARGVGKPLWEESKRAGASGRGQRTGREVGEGSSGRARKVG